ncbi:MAG: hypothetical protein EOO39_12920, partial [Cytophagaceae bacterium]
MRGRAAFLQGAQAGTRLSTERVRKAMASRLSLFPAGRLASVAAGLALTVLVPASGVDTSYQISAVLIARDHVRVSLYTIPGTALAEETIARLDGNRDGAFPPPKKGR